MIDLVLDSSALRALRPNGPEARALRELVKLGAVMVHVSTIVEREVATGLADETMAKLRVNWAPEALRVELEQAVKLVKNAGPSIELGVKEWLDSVGAKRHAPTLDETNRVFDGYFLHKKPFRSRKSREDLPDAFIVESLRTFTQISAGQIRFVTRDAALAAAAKELAGVEVHKELHALLASIDIARPVTPKDMRECARGRLDEIKEAIIAALPDALHGFEVRSHSFPSDNSDATIMSAGAANELDLDTVDAAALGLDTLSIPFHCVVEDCLLALYIHKADYGLVDDRRYSVSDWNERYLHAETYRTVRVEGDVLVQVRPSPSPKSGRRELEFGDMDVEVREVEVVEVVD